MDRRYIKKFVLPPGPILSLILLGLLLIGAIVYYRAVKIQRFLEPALAISQPKIKFTQTIKELLSRDFGKTGIEGLKFKAGSILLDQALLIGEEKHGGDPRVLQKLASVLHSALDQRDMREHISIIMVGIRYPIGPDPEWNRMTSLRNQQKAWLLLNSLYASEPQLEMVYGTYFIAAAIPVKATSPENDWVEFRIVPTERLHIDVLQRLEKYMR